LGILTHCEDEFGLTQTYMYAGETEKLIQEKASASWRQVDRKLKLASKAVKNIDCCAVWSEIPGLSVFLLRLS